MGSGRLKGGKNRRYSVEEKMQYVNMNLKDHISNHAIQKRCGIPHGNIQRWVNAYLSDGKDGLKPKKKGNPYSALYTSKHLTELQRLQLENAKQKIEIARLKKEYMAKGAGAEKEYVSISGKSSKQSKG